MEEKNAFVLMPFAEEFADVFQHFISESLTSAGYKVQRADDIKSQNNIIRDIIVGITTSDLIVADLTGSNPNVYYELGIAHALNKNVILLTQEIGELPFDLRSYRVIAYSIHFAKMNLAKEELTELATEAFKGKLLFGNPVKDFANTPQIIAANQVSATTEENEELGIIDHKINLEDGFGALAAVISDVGDKLVNDLTPKIISSTEMLNSGKKTSKQQRNIVKELSDEMREYSSFVKPRNLKYRETLKSLESGLEYLLNNNFEIDDDNQKNEISNFLEILNATSKSASTGKLGFLALIESMNALPPIEKSFNREKVFMVSELDTFVDNIDQTISMIARINVLGNNLINKILQTLPK
ncbi:MAG: hypothetical protein ACI9SK_001287 [Zhongshania sp.]|jgi:hypothetical protein